MALRKKTRAIPFLFFLFRLSPGVAGVGTEMCKEERIVQCVFWRSAQLQDALHGGFSKTKHQLHLPEQWHKRHSFVSTFELMWSLLKLKYCAKPSVRAGRGKHSSDMLGEGQASPQAQQSCFPITSVLSGWALVNRSDACLLWPTWC